MTPLEQKSIRHELVAILASLRTVSARIPDGQIDPRLKSILDGTVSKIEFLTKLVEGSEETLATGANI